MVRNSRKLTEAPSFYKSFRSALRSKFFALLRHLSGIDDFRDIFSSLLRDHAIYPALVELDNPRPIEPPNYDLGQEGRRSTRFRDDIVFITGRFRSGSTLMWNIFRNIPSATCYYEPLNERRWFDKHSRGSRIDATHRGVSDYWSEYDGLEVLSDYYDEKWTHRNLYMNANAWDPRLERYIEILAEAAKNRPVLQFNRVDFRLAWLRSRFPNAKILHIYRHPRDQWCSSLVDTRRFPKEMKLRDFGPFDGFYLLSWGRDLHRYFPFLTLDADAHPYELFYQIWKLSYVFGKRYSDWSVPFEQILDKPEESIRDILKATSIDGMGYHNLHKLIRPVQVGKWTVYAGDDWFRDIEGKVEGVIQSFNHNS